MGRPCATDYTNPRRWRRCGQVVVCWCCATQLHAVLWVVPSQARERWERNKSVRLGLPASWGHPSMTSLRRSAPLRSDSGPKVESMLPDETVCRSSLDCQCSGTPCLPLVREIVNRIRLLLLLYHNSLPGNSEKNLLRPLWTTFCLESPIIYILGAAGHICRPPPPLLGFPCCSAEPTQTCPPKHCITHFPSLTPHSPSVPPPPSTTSYITQGKQTR